VRSGRETFVGGAGARSRRSARGLLRLRRPRARALIEEPELYLRPQAQRYLYRLLREFSSGGNQVIYSTHSPSFLNVARLDELVFVERIPDSGTRAAQPRPVTPADDFRVLTEFDAVRGELFLSRAAVLVEGQTEKLVLPFVFAALGYDPDREAISIVECGGKPNIPLFAGICRAVGLPFVVVHDSDARPGRKPVAAERRIVIEPDFEAVAGLQGHSHKPERAWRRFHRLRSRSRSRAPLSSPSRWLASDEKDVVVSVATIRDAQQADVGSRSVPAPTW
jgi:predicted ATP-dependent endonuclease of OLD family